jgi:hypothetical protein
MDNLKFMHLVSSEEGVEINNQPLLNYLDYEIRGSWWAQWIAWDWLQKIIGGYFARKTKRKFLRFVHSKENSAYMSRPTKEGNSKTHLTNLRVKSINLNDQEGSTFDIHIPTNRKVRISFDHSNYAEISMSSCGDVRVHQLTGKNPKIYNFAYKFEPGKQVVQEYTLSRYDKELLFWYFEGYNKTAYQSTNPYIKPEYHAVWNLGTKDAKSGICESMPGIINPKTLERIYEAIRQ